MKCSLGISNFLDEYSSLSHSIVFLYFFAVPVGAGHKRPGEGISLSLVSREMSGKGPGLETGP